MGNASKNPPSTCDVPKDSFDWTLVKSYDKEVDTSKEEEEKRTIRIKEFRTLKEMGATKTASSELYGFIKAFTEADDPDGVIKSAPPESVDGIRLGDFVRNHTNVFRFRKSV